MNSLPNASRNFQRILPFFAWFVGLTPDQSRWKAELTPRLGGWIVLDQGVLSAAEHWFDANCLACGNRGWLPATGAGGG